MQFNVGESAQRKTALIRRYARVAGGYRQAAAVLDEIGARLLSRLDYIRCAPQRVLDVGCGVGSAFDQLRRRYPKAQLIGGDLSLAMLQQVRQPRWRKATGLLQTDFEALPLRDRAIDLILAGSALQYSDHPEAVFAEWLRVAAEGGLMLFVSFGPDTLRELRQALRETGLAGRLPDFMDMHDLGDSLLRAGWVDPVVDSEVLQVTYPDLRSGLRELLSLAPSQSVGRGLLTQNLLLQLEAHYAQDQDGRYPATLELVYGHAWAPQSRYAKAEGGGKEVRVSIDAIRRPTKSS